MKGNLHPTNDVTLNPSANASIRDVIAETCLSRRTLIRTSVDAGTLTAIGGVTMSGIMTTVEASTPRPGVDVGTLGFAAVPPSLAPVADAVAVPAGYRAEVLAAWGDPITDSAPPWSEDATQDAAAQAMQFGEHCDGMHYFPFTWRGRASSKRGLLCVNHEYTHEEILHGPEGLGGGSGVTIEKIRKSQAAHGISVVDIVRRRGLWGLNLRSPFARRITGNTRMRVSGPAAGHELMRSKRFDIQPTGSVEIGVNDGRTAFGTLNNCAHGYTPWGTYLTCEENWNGYFVAPTNGAAIGPEYAHLQAEIVKSNNRYGVNTGFGYQWHVEDPRFDADYNPLEPNLFGWVVEIDPFDPSSTPVKHTALGRIKRESAQVAVAKDGHGKERVAFYMGDDERNEYIYKFVCARPLNRQDRRANRNLLDSGTLFVAKFTAVPGSRPGTFRGEWLPLVPSMITVIDDPATPGRKLRLRELASFAGANDAEVQALILIKTRQAADAVGATMMDRPEWIALRSYGRAAPPHAQSGRSRRWWDWGSDGDGPDDCEHPGWSRGQDFDYPVYDQSHSLELYCTLTNNSNRGGGNSSAPGVTTSNKPDGTTAAGSARPAVDAANPRPDNDYGHIIRWRERGNSVTALKFEWDIFVLCGDTATTKTLSSSYDPTDPSGVGYFGNIVDAPNGSTDFGAPDGLWFDQFGRLWIQTDQAGNAAGDWVNIGANIMACADPGTKEIRRFLTAPPRSEVTGVVNTPDGKTMFVGIQHPGEDSLAANPAALSNWPQSQFTSNSAGEALPNTPGLSRPRSSVLVITREDGGIIGA